MLDHGTQVVIEFGDEGELNGCKEQNPLNDCDIRSDEDYDLQQEWEVIDGSQFGADMLSPYSTAHHGRAAQTSAIHSFAASLEQVEQAPPKSRTTLYVSSEGLSCKLAGLADPNQDQTHFCGICLQDNCLDGRNTPCCDVTFCRACLDEWIDFEGGVDSAACPNCKDAFGRHGFLKSGDMIRSL